MTMWRDLVRRNFWLKVGSLFLATIIWLAIHRYIERSESRAATQVFNHLPVTVLTEAGETRGFQVFPAEVSVKASGPASIIEHLNERDFEAYVNLTGSENADEMLKKVEVVTLKGLDILRVDPARVRVTRAAPSAPSQESKNHAKP
jgi:YbbR domain-containing protein